MHRLGALIFLGILSGTALGQQTEIYKCVDKTGRPLYTSDKRETAGMKCTLVSREINVVPSQSRSGKASGSFPRETSADRFSAKERQRGILENELATEQQLLEKARQELAVQEATRSGDERNYARVLQRLQPYKDSVETHEKNIEALKRELGNVNR